MNTNMDTYFLNAQEALKTAIQKNSVPTNNPRISGLQICYYSAEEPLENAPENCIWLPLENVYNYLITTKNRIPKAMNFDNTNYPIEEQQELAVAFQEIINRVNLEKNNLAELYLKEIENLQPDFNDTPLRIFVPACRETTVMQYISKNIANALKKLGYDVTFFIQENAMQGCENMLAFFHAMHDCNPHITININHLNNHYLPENVINIVWFQDMMPILQSDLTIELRKNDNIFALTEGIERKIKEKNLPVEYQPFCIDTDIYTIDPSIQREDKLVFIGSSNKHLFDQVNHPKKYELFNLLSLEFLQEVSFTLEKKEEYCKKYAIELEDINRIINYIYRVIALDYLKNNLDYPIEVYGYEWEDTNLSSCYKGTLEYGEEVSKVYNSAKYTITLGGYALQQRTLEAAASGCIPLILDNRSYHNKDKDLDQYLHFFNKIQDVQELINNLTPKDVQPLIQKRSYMHFAKDIIAKVKEVHK